jgi:predicted dehydrogenase
VRRVVRVGVIGTGFGGRVVAPVFGATEGVEVVEVVSARDERAVGSLCRRSDVDLVSVHSPPFLHAAHVRLALAGGRPAVLCDKPFGRQAAESEQLLAEAEAAGTRHLVNFEFRHHPARLRLRELITSGVAGGVRHLAWVHHTAGSTQPMRPHGWLFRRDCGGGWIGAWAPHAVDTVRWLLGDIDVASVHAVLRTDVPVRPSSDGDREPMRVDVEDGLVADFVTTAGATVSLDSTFAAAAASPPRIVVIGGDAVIECLADRRITVRSPAGNAVEEIDVGPPGAERHDVAMSRWAEVVRDAVRDGRQIQPSFADGVECDRVLDRLRAGRRMVAPDPD